MVAVLELDPVAGPLPVPPLAMLGHQAFEAHQTSVAEQVGANLALFKVSLEDAVHAPGQKPSEVIFAEMEGKLAESLAGKTGPGCATMFSRRKRLGIGWLYESHQGRSCHD